MSQFSATEATVGVQLYKTIEALKRDEGPLNREEILESTGIDVMSNPELWAALVDNPKLQFNEISGTLQYKPEFNIKSKEDLLQLLHDHIPKGGIEVKDLIKSWSDVIPAILELELANNVLVIRTDDNKPKTVFWNDPSLTIKTSPEFVKYWHEVQVPRDSDLARELEKAGMRSLDVTAPMVRHQASPKVARKRRSKRVRLTNLHMNDVAKKQDRPYVNTQ